MASRMGARGFACGRQLGENTDDLANEDDETVFASLDEIEEEADSLEGFIGTHQQHSACKTDILSFMKSTFV